MHPTRRLLAAAYLVAATLCWPTDGHAAKFKSAEVTKIVNDVKLLTGTSQARAASRGAVVRGSTAVRTGQKSRAELQFPDESVVRLGSNSVFSFLQGKREVDLKQGTLLLQVPKTLGRTRVKTAAISAAITGTTILIEIIPEVLDENGRVIRPLRGKIIVVEGSLEFSLNNAPRKTMKLVAGEMVVFSADAKTLPNKFQIDLERLVKTSLLVDGGMGPLVDVQLIANEVDAQKEEKRRGRLLLTNIFRGPRNDAAGGLLSRFLPGNAISQARAAVNARPPLSRPRPIRIAPPDRGPGTPSGGFVTVTAEVTGTPVSTLFVDVEVTQP